MKPDADDRCGFYLKGTDVQIDENMSIDPTDDLTFDYDDMKQLLGETAALTRINMPPIKSIPSHH